MDKSLFQCKSFSFFQSERVHKFGTDTLLLAIHLNRNLIFPKYILDIGTGTGFLALALSQIYPKAHIQAIDIDDEAVKLASENVLLNHFENQITIEKCNLVDFHSKYLFDLIVSNPPFYHEDTKSPEQWRADARNADSMPLNDLFQKCAAWLSENGQLVLIYPLRNLSQLLINADQFGLYLNKRINIFAKSGCEAKRVILFFSKSRTEKTIESYSMRDENGLPNSDFERDRLLWMMK